MIDIYDINFEYCDENLGILNSPPANLPKKGKFTRILSLIKGVIVHGILKKTSDNKIDTNSTLFFAISKNEINSITPITLKLPDAVIFGVDNFKNGYPLGKIYWFSFAFIPIVFYRFLICYNRYHKKSFGYAFDGFCIAYASKYVLKKYLRKLRPKKIVIANQLSFFHRSLAFAAKDLDIETIYMQHASVTEKFDNLNVFSAALLEGEDSLLKYQINGTTQKKLYLIGMPKFDKFFDQVSEYGGIKTIGICTNGMDDINAFSELIVFLKLKLQKVQICVRPHPADRRKLEWLAVAERNNCLFSDVSKIDSFSFFRYVDLIVSGDSNIHLEATLLNIPSVYFDPQAIKLDWYGFAKNSLVFYASDVESVCNYISNLSFSGRSIRNKAKYYVDTVNTLYDGNSTNLAAMIIQGEQLNDCFLTDEDCNNNIVFRVK